PNDRRIGGGFPDDLNDRRANHGRRRSDLGRRAGDNEPPSRNDRGQSEDAGYRDQGSYGHPQGTSMRRRDDVRREQDHEGGYSRRDRDADEHEADRREGRSWYH